jgi:lipid II isoglutaminyl synthase (glutamine-hydrolysing)
MSADLVLVHLYPDLLRTYGDRGNVLTLQRRAEWRGFTVDVVGVRRGERLPPSPSLVLIGGGTDRVQEVLAPDLKDRRGELEEAVAGGTVLLGVCGGYQFMGRTYIAADGTEIEGLGFLDIATRAGRDRIIGRVRARARLWEQDFDLVGFENHGGRTELGPRSVPLAKVTMGGGNNGRDGTEGAVQGTMLGTYIHGPLLPPNPRLADVLLHRALAPVTGGEPLAPLRDDLEEAAHRAALSLKR